MGGDGGFYRKAVSKADVAIQPSVWAAWATAVAKGNTEPGAGSRIRVGLVSQCQVVMGDMRTVVLSQVVMMMTLIVQQVCTIQTRWRLPLLLCCQVMHPHPVKHVLFRMACTASPHATLACVL